MSLDYPETNGSSMNADDAQAKRDAYRKANNQIIEILEDLDGQQRGRIIRSLQEHYAEDLRKRAAKGEGKNART